MKPDMKGQNKLQDEMYEVEEETGFKIKTEFSFQSLRLIPVMYVNVDTECKSYFCVNSICLKCFC